jgi:hypothetical protein
MRTRFVPILAALVLAGGLLASCSDATPSSAHGGPPPPSGGYNSKGFPLDENGDASSNPEDYREAVCNSGLVDDAPDYDEECR